MIEIRFVTTVTATPGSAELRFGPFIGPADAQYLYPEGFLAVEWGDFATTQTGEFPVTPAPWQSSQFGQPTAFNLSQFIVPINFGAQTLFGDHTIYIPEDQHAGAAGLNATQWGTTFVSWHLRWVTHGNAYSGPLAGVPSVINRIRYVYPAWSVFSQYGTAMMGRHADVDPVGWSAMGTGQPHVEWGNVLQAQGWKSDGAVPQPWVSRSPRVLAPQQGAASTEWGDAYVWRLRQTVTHLGFPWEAQGTKFGDFTLVENRNRTVGAFGFSADRVPITAFVANTGRALLPEGLGATQWGGDTFIADRIRTIGGKGLDSFSASNFGTTIHNAARVLAPSGWRSGAAGRPEWVESNLQTVRQHSVISLQPGTPMISDAVRTVTQYPWSSASHRAGYPTVWFNRVAPAGIDTGGLGSVVVLGPYIRTITPRWIHRHLLGNPGVRNVTPQLWPPGRPYSEFGLLSWVSFRVRGLLPAWSHTDAIGRHSIGDRTRRPQVSGWLSFSSPPNAHTARNVDPDPPWTRTIAARWFPVGDDSWRTHAAQFVGLPSVSANSLRPEGWHSLLFGEASLFLQGAAIENRYNHTEWGFNRVEHRERRILSESVVFDSEVGKPGLSPHTIWAPLGAPAQAITNHPVFGQLHAIGELEEVGHADSRWPWFGHTAVSHWTQRAQHYHDDDSTAVGKTLFGEAAAVEWRRRLNVHDQGIYSFVPGRPVLLPHTRRIRPLEHVSLEIGAHIVALGDTRQYVTGAQAVNEQRWGVPFLWGGMRFVLPVGSAHTAWGNNNPMVHYPRKFSITGGDLYRAGTAWLSHLHRPLFVEGTDMLQIDWADFNTRMRVTEYRKPLAISGFSTMHFGTPALAKKQQFITAYMIPPPRCMSIKTTVAHV